MVIKEREMLVGYDKFSLDHGLLLDLPFREVAGFVTRDIAKPHHQDVALQGFAGWLLLANGLGVMAFNGLMDYLDCPAAATGDLDFTTGDYSIAVWMYHTASAQSDIIIGRYGVDLDGWELYIGPTVPRTIDLRHHHSSLPEDRDGCYSEDWPDNTWYLVGVSRSGLYPLMYRNGLPLEMTYGAFGLRDPDTCNRDLVVGTRFTKDANWYHGMMWRPRVWGRALDPYEMRQIFNMERHLFSV